MAVKSVIDVQINDEKFKQFTGLFGQYQAALKELPSDWAKVNAEIGGANGVFEAFVAAMLAQSQLITKIEKTNKDTTNTTAKNATYWRDMSKSTRDVAGNIVNATTALLKWIGLTSVFSGLLGAGGLYGIDRMAAGVASGQRSSQRLGMTYGENKAFDIAFSPVVDTGRFLGSVNEALSDLTKKGGFIGAGLTPGEQQGGTAQVALNLLDHLKQFADATDPSNLANMMTSKGLDQHISLEELKALRAKTPEEYSEFRNRFVDEKSRLNLSGDTQSAWTRFTQQMEDAGVSIENVFVRSLVKIEPQLADLSKGFVKLVEAIGDSDVVKGWIESAGRGLERFSTYINGQDFRDAVNGFLASLDKLSESLSWVADKFSVSPEYKAAHPSKYPAKEGTPEWDLENKRLSDGRPQYQPNGKPWPTALKFDDIEKAHGLPKGMLNSIYGAESSSGANKNTSSAGAVGPFQFLPATAEQYGVKDSRDLDQSSQGAGRFLDHLAKVFDKDWVKVVAAYNSGEGTVANAVTSAGILGGDWRHYLPQQETRDYIRKVIPRDSLEDYVKSGRNGVDPNAPKDQSAGSLAGADFRALVSLLSKQSSKSVIEIYNNSGANVIQSASQVVVGG